MNRTFCFVPVRKGSRGIPGKNLRMLGDKPLVCWIIDTILASGIADEVCVATNCDEMESLIRGRYKGVVQIFRRSEWSARDEAPSLEVVQEFFHFRKPDRNDVFILLQATSPFTIAQELRGLAEEMKRGEADSYVACCRLKKFRWSDEGTFGLFIRNQTSPAGVQRFSDRVGSFLCFYGGENTGLRAASFGSCEGGGDRACRGDRYR